MCERPSPRTKRRKGRTYSIADHLGEAKVRNLAQGPQTPGEQQILGLEVTMGDSLRMKVGDRFADHERNLASLAFG